MIKAEAIVLACCSFLRYAYSLSNKPKLWDSLFMLDFIHQPEGTIRLGDYLRLRFQQRQWSHFRAAIAFVKYSGVRHICQSLTEFSYNASVKISVGIDHGGTSMEGLRTLLESIGNRGEIWIYHNENYSSFHPKIYLFKNDSHADILVGSGNLTEGGLFTNYEASLALSLDLTLEEHRNLLQQIESIFDTWSDQAQGTAQRLTPELLNSYLAPAPKTGFLAIVAA